MAQIRALPDQSIASRMYAPELNTKPAMQTDVTPRRDMFRSPVPKQEIATKDYTPDAYIPAGSSALPAIQLASKPYTPELNTSPATSTKIESRGGRRGSGALEKPQIAGKDYTIQAETQRNAGQSALPDVNNVRRIDPPTLFRSSPRPVSSFAMSSPVAGVHATLHQPVPGMESPLDTGPIEAQVFAMRNVVAQQTAMPDAQVVEERNFRDPLPPGTGRTKVLVMDPVLSQNSATVKQDVFFRTQYPDPPPSEIGDDDLPGGFRREAVMTGQSEPLYDLARGVVQIDNVKVLFNALA